MERTSEILPPEPPRPVSAGPEPLRPEPLRIDCDDCALQHTEACGDCVVTFLCTREADDAVVIDVAEVRALRMLSDTGLAPQLRHRPRTG